MTEWVARQLELLRAQWPDLEYDQAGHWVRIPGWELPPGWSPPMVDIAFQIKEAADQPPYAFYVNATDLKHNGNAPGNWSPSTDQVASPAPGASSPGPPRPGPRPRTRPRPEHGHVRPLVRHPVRRGGLMHTLRITEHTWDEAADLPRPPVRTDGVLRRDPHRRYRPDLTATGPSSTSCTSTTTTTTPTRGGPASNSPTTSGPQTLKWSNRAQRRPRRDPLPRRGRLGRPRSAPPTSAA